MPGKRPKGKIDPSRALAPCVAGTPAAGRNDLPVLPDCSGTDGWHGGADDAGLDCGRRGCNSVVRGHSASRYRTPLGIRCQGKPVAAEPILRVPPCVLAGGARQRQWLRGTLEAALIGDLTKVAMPELRRFQRRSSFLLLAFHVKIHLQTVSLMTGRMMAPSARMMLSTGSRSENYVFR
jgi:hypothetical protein